ncbi:DUF4145 domain-containing protein [Denitrobaculum tricleocarpae]|uniref:DUF4145 domain-containing protein n=1 Tax=Denitrobaculum tricleocarpae TaxID=2591009 RepID=A0A545TT71_9PROT|nr:DUF4145 domain-containing protein [Denitrobaculum tricleocarpae]TQV80341.1 DUF4145 domain-containing protein [Denitrobaculum tricleocarpae]
MRLIGEIAEEVVEALPVMAMCEHSAAANASLSVENRYACSKSVSTSAGDLDDRQISDIFSPWWLISVRGLLDMADTPRHFRHDCPHCGTKSIALDVVYSDYRERPVRSGYKKVQHLYLRCPECDYGSFAVILKDLKAASEGRSHTYHFSPRQPQPNIPAHLPEAVRSAFSQGCEILQASPNGSVALFRRALELGLNRMLGKSKDRLVKKIDKAAENSLVTPDLAEWAHGIRLEGNEALHDDYEYSALEAEEVRDFAQMMLTYIFTMPETVKAMRAKPEGDGE